jgi:hypothetical protein
LHADDLPVVAVEAQPLGAQLSRLVEALDGLGHPLPEEAREAIAAADEAGDAAALQRAIDPLALCFVTINPEERVKVERGPAAAELQQGGYIPCIIKVVNEADSTAALRIGSPQAGAVYAGASLGILERQQQTELNENENTEGRSDRFIDVSLHTSPPMTANLSGLEVEYVIAVIYADVPGRREATLTFDIGQGTQDIGFRGEVPVLFDVARAVPVRLWIKDVDGSPTTARLVIHDEQGRVYPSQLKRLAPDFFFQKQIYRSDNSIIQLPPGVFAIQYSRGPEYVVHEQEFEVVAPFESDGGRTEVQELTLELERWVDPAAHGFYSGDHHIHGAGCAHYQSPTEGVRPEDMFLQVKGEGLNVGCVLTWGPCYDFQRRYFSPQADRVSQPTTIIKYDLEISGFGSQALGHVCLLDLEDQTYPGSEGRSDIGWPTWTVPVLRWAKEQGGVTGYPHSDMRVDPEGAADELFRRLDLDANGNIDRNEADHPLLPMAFEEIEMDEDGVLTPGELIIACDRAGNDLPNVVFPAMNGAGAMEIFVAVNEGVCDFNSAMDTGRIGEWNTWYHIMNCGYPLKISGETDFPCMSSTRVGQGRVYVRLADGPVTQVDYGEWCDGVAAGRSYVSDGFAHALEFTVNEVRPGVDDVALDAPGTVTVNATVSFAEEVPIAVSHGTLETDEGRREVGDTRVLHAPRRYDTVIGGDRLVELIVNGEVVASQVVPADGATHDLTWDVPIERSSWVALRQFPQLHTNPVNVIVDNQPIRASEASALWCAACVELCWANRNQFISEDERPAAEEAYRRAAARYLEIAEECTR